jgi:hypothetical protein
MVTMLPSMRSRRLHPVRMVRILLACAVLWLGTGSAARADAWRETVAAVAHVQVPSAGVQDGVAAERSAATRQLARAKASDFHASPLRQEPPNARSALHPNRRVYLRNCVLLR